MNTMQAFFKFLFQMIDQFGRGFISVEEIGRYVSEAQVHLFNYYKDRLPQREAEEALSPFVRNTTPPVGTVAFLPLPNDYDERIALFAYDAATGLMAMVQVGEERAVSKLASNSMRSTNMYATERSDRFEMYPVGTNVAGLTMRYYCLPTDVVFGYTLLSNGDYLINDAPTAFPTAPGIPPLPASVLPIFRTTYWPMLAQRALALAGIKLGDADLYGAVERMRAEEEAR